MDEARDNQAQLLKQQIDEMNQNEVMEDESESFFDGVPDDIDVLNLPPRSVVHDEKRTKLKWKISIAFIRFIAILFFITVILVLTYNYWGNYFF
ncbi:hypothetical protein KQI76_03640 [Amphibacillus sp. MSJ-3]|uniref:hypothetical protein n=1 Tax=Amphibacillus sp. MSJ-3 TaxID=2841505 RepID=UPI001C0EA527|nr:hypothetical protein [Amphibacillus sp. MSJ-3]MBU5594247.1 hypothetical protein [Amphibacillus sp. MSJ-3]